MTVKRSPFEVEPRNRDGEHGDGQKVSGAT
jgi:hypothetical protein